MPQHTQTLTKQRAIADEALGLVGTLQAPTNHRLDAAQTHQLGCCNKYRPYQCIVVTSNLVPHNS